MAEPRSAHTATLLPDGRVLVVGGIGKFVSPMETRMLDSAELFDPATGRWTSAERSSDPRSGHTATLLPDGTVLVVGGTLGFGRTVASAELYDPRDGSWSTTDAPIQARYDHTATLLADGAVLLVGGVSGDAALASAEAYDPRSEQWSATASLAAARTRHTATLLTDGKVIVVGGNDLVDGVVPVAELYDPGSSS